MKTLKICLALGVVSVLAAILLIFARTLWIFVVLLWILLFCGGAILPSCAGIVVSIVPKAYRAVSSSMNLMIFNIFGYFLSLSLSGYFMQLMIMREGCDYTCARISGFRMIMLWSILSLTFLALALESGCSFISTNLFCSESHSRLQKTVLSNLSDRVTDGQEVQYPCDL